MFDNDFFESWLDEKAKELIDKIAKGESLKSEEMIILVLKAQTNHFYHLDKELREELQELRKDMDKRFEEIDKRFEQVDKRFEEVDKRFEQVDKRFEQVDKRFEQVDKRFEDMLRRMDRFMFWTLGMIVASTFFIIKFLGH